MTINGLVFALMLGAIILGLAAVVIDRINFPQKPFRPKQIVTDGKPARRDRTGAHIVDVYDPEDNDLDHNDPDNQEPGAPNPGAQS